MSFFNRHQGGRDTIYNHFAYNDNFTICLGSQDSEISEEVISFHPNTERINDDVLVDGKKVDLSDTKIRIINAQIFGGSVEEILFPKTLLKIEGTFADRHLKTVSLEKTQLGSFESRLFQGCTDLETVTFPDCLWMIEGEAFADCRKLKKLDLRSTHVGTIQKKAFSGCKDLEEVLFSEDLFSIGAFAFQDTSLREIDLKNAKEIDLSAFSDTKIECIELPKSVSAVSYSGIKSKEIKVPSFFASEEDDIARLQRGAEAGLKKALEKKPGKRINVSYPGKDEEVLKTLEFLEESGFINLID